jgi:tRNA 2-thiouridine synthesizing protein A
MTLTETELATVAAAKVVDARGSACPGPLLEAKKAMPTIAVGQTIELWSTDPGTKTDVGAWSTKVGHAYLGTLPAEGYERTFVTRGK